MNRNSHPHRTPPAPVEAMRRSLVMQMALGQAHAAARSDSDDILPRPRSAAALVERFRVRLTPEARKLLQPTFSTPAYFTELLTAELDADARRVLASALPKRRALWWTCLCTWDGLGNLSDGTADEILRAIVGYVAQPGVEKCRRVAEAARGVKRASLLGCLVHATYVAGGSVTPPDKPRVAAPPHVFGRLIEASVYLAAVTRDIVNYRRHLREYLLLGQQLAAGPAPWRQMNSQQETSR